MPFGVPQDSGRSTVLMKVMTKSGQLSFEASQGILCGAEISASQYEIARGVLLAGATNTGEISGEFCLGELRFSYHVPPVDAAAVTGRTCAWLVWNHGNADDCWDAERVLAQSLLPLLQHLRAKHPELVSASVIYVADEPLAFVEGQFRATMRWTEPGESSREWGLPLADSTMDFPARIDRLPNQRVEQGMAFAQRILSTQASREEIGILPAEC